MQDTTFRHEIEVIRKGFATPHALTGVPGKISGCIYRSDGTKVSLSERFGGHMGDYVVSENAETAEIPSTSISFAGRGIYLGNFMGGHYGHFITETLSSFWVFEQFPASDFDYFLFHPFVFGDGLPEYVRYSFDAFGIDPDKVRLVGDEAVALEEILVPERLFRLNHSADPKLKWAFDRLAARSIAPSAPARRLYLSRRRFSRVNFERVVANEVRLEDEFRRRGFQVLYPEQLAFARQVGFYSQADIVAGLSGSGLHNSLVMKPGATVIELGDPRYGGEPAPTQALCNIVSGVCGVFIPFRGRRFGRKGTMLFDMRFLRDRLDAAIGSAAPDLPARPRRSLTGMLLEGLEIAYLCVRPALGSILRELLGRLRSNPTR